MTTVGVGSSEKTEQSEGGSSGDGVGVAIIGAAVGGVLVLAVAGFFVYKYVSAPNDGGKANDENGAIQMKVVTQVTLPAQQKAGDPGVVVSDEDEESDGHAA